MGQMKSRATVHELYVAEQGIAFLLTIFTLLFVSLLVITGYQLNRSQLRADNELVRSQRAVRIAEAGCEMLMAYLTNFADRNGTLPPDFALKEQEFGGGVYTVQAFHTENWDYDITSQGRYGGITRVVKATVRLETSDWDKEMIITSWGPLELHGTINGPVWSADQVTIKNNIFDIIFSGFTTSSIDEVFITKGHTVTPTTAVENGIHEARYRPPVLVGAGYFDQIKAIADRVLTSATISDLNLDATPLVYYDGNELTLTGALRGNGRIVCRGNIKLGNVSFWSQRELVFQNEGGQQIDLVAGGDIKINYISSQNEDDELAGRWLANNQINFLAVEIFGFPLKQNFLKNFAGSLRTNKGGKIVIWNFTFRPPPPTETEFDQHVVTILDWQVTAGKGQTEGK